MQLKDLVCKVKMVQLSAQRVISTVYHTQINQMFLYQTWTLDSGFQFYAGFF